MIQATPPPHPPIPNRQPLCLRARRCVFASPIISVTAAAGLCRFCAPAACAYNAVSARLSIRQAPNPYVAENPSVPVVICPRSASAAIIPSTLDMLREYGSSNRINASCRCPHGNATSASPTFSISP